MCMSLCFVLIPPSPTILSDNFCCILLTSFSPPNNPPPSTFNERRRSQPDRALRTGNQSTIQKCAWSSGHNCQGELRFQMSLPEGYMWGWGNSDSNKTLIVPIANSVRTGSLYFRGEKELYSFSDFSLSPKWY